MSAPVYELLKRPDELHVVEHAHLHPRFVEDSVRIALEELLDSNPALDDDDFVLSRQVNLETIHDHDVVAERWGTVGEIRGELDGDAPPARQTTLEAWLRRLTKRARTAVAFVIGTVQSPPGRSRPARTGEPPCLRRGRARRKAGRTWRTRTQRAEGAPAAPPTRPFPATETTSRNRSGAKSAVTDCAALELQAQGRAGAARPTSGRSADPRPGAVEDTALPGSQSVAQRPRSRGRARRSPRIRRLRP